MSSVLDIARAEVGTTEDPPNSNRVKYWSETFPGGQGQPWCAAFTTWCWQQVGVDIFAEIRAGAFRVYTVMDWAKSVGAWATDRAEPGDLAVYNYGEGHIGIAWPDPATTTYRAIEGNTSASDVGSQSNGGGVFVRYRPRSRILGWVRMSVVAEHLGVAVAPAQAPAQPVAAHPLLAVDGQLGPQTYRALQRVIDTPADGIWGPASRRALQRWLGVTVDGIVGPATIRALQRRVGARVDGDWGPNTTRALQTYLNQRSTSL